ncbi:MAG: cation:proton antiporter [Alphaproteobacteria bacterium]|nr:cation:proton antiporter [Alphaproteobacteria bacterium]
MGAAAPSPAVSALRTLGTGLALTVALLALREGDPSQVAPVVAGLAIVLAWGVGRLLPRAGMPSVLGWLTVGVLFGPAASALLTRVVPGWLFPEGVLGPDELAVLERPAHVGLGLIMLWAGRQLDVRELRGAKRAISGLLLGHVAAAAALTAFVSLVAEMEGVRTFLGIAVARDPADLAGFAVSFVGTSIALVVAVVHPARSSGPVTRTVLWLAVLGEAVAVATLGVWATWWGPWTGLLIDDPGTSVQLVFAASIGVTLGVLIAVVSRWAPEARGPWTVGVGILGTMIATQVGLSAPLALLVAGVVVANLRPAESTAAETVATGVSLVTVLTWAAAQLPIVDLLDLAPIALALALVRGVVLFGAAIAMARLLQAPTHVVRYGWTGLIASAMPVAGLVVWRELDVSVEGAGVIATALVWNLSAIHGLLGVVAVHLALGLARETPEARAELARQPAPPVSDDGWIDPVVLAEGPLREHVADLAHDLHALASELRGEAAHVFLEPSQAYVDELRKEFRRHHRKVTAVVQGDPADVEDGVRAARIELVDRWRTHVLDHAAHMNRHPWRPVSLVDLLDRIAQHSPEVLPAPVDPAHRANLRDFFVTFTGWLVGAAPRREVPFREILRHHLSGRVPVRLEAVASLQVNAELHLASRTRELFHRVLDAYDPPDHGVIDLDALERIREDIGDDFRCAREEIDGVLDDMVTRLHAVLGHTFAEVVDDLRRVGSLDLSARARTMSKAKAERAAGMDALTRRYNDARDAARVRFTALGLELELDRLELEVEGALGDHGSHLARLVRGRGTTQLERVDEALAEGLAQIHGLLDAGLTGRELAAALRAEEEALSRVAADAASTAEDLRLQLSADELLSPLLDALVRAGSLLTDHEEVPVGTLVGGSWALMERGRTQDVAFREVVVGYIETAITRDLNDLTQRFAVAIEGAIKRIAEVERVFGFNLELAAAEVATVGDEPVGSDQLRAVQDLVLDGLSREQTALHHAVEGARGWFDEVDTRLREAVLDDLDNLRVRIADGRFAEIARERATAREVGAAAAEDVEHRLKRVARWWLGDARAERIRDRLGLPQQGVPGGALVPALFAPPPVASSVPLSYRRLFSEQALQAGELLGGRQVQADRVRRALADHQGARLRTVAVVGPDGVGKPAIVRAALRAMRVRGVQRFDLTGPVDPHEVAGWFERPTQDHVCVVTGFHWLYQMRPGGFEALRRFVDGVVADGGRNAWIVDADETVWTFARGAAPLDKAFPTVVRIAPLDDAELEEAILARHAMSGMTLTFDVDDPRRPSKVQRAWFKAFHAATGGIARDAMHLWLASVAEVDATHQVVRMGPVHGVAPAAMRELSDKSALGLQVAARQGYVDEETWMRLFRDPPLETRTHLAHLVHWGLLQTDGARYVLPAHLRRPLLDLLAERGWR